MSWWLIPYTNVFGLANLCSFASFLWNGNSKRRLSLVSTGRSISMNKSELIAKVATDTRLTRGEAEEVVDSTIENIIKALMDGDDVRLMGFGVFTVTRREAGKARNPRTGKIIKMPASNRARFKPGKLLKEAVNS
jgi:DNA-binding protein HU-beta